MIGTQPVHGAGWFIFLGKFAEPEGVIGAGFDLAVNGAHIGSADMGIDRWADNGYQYNKNQDNKAGNGPLISHQAAQRLLKWSDGLFLGPNIFFIACTGDGTIW